MSEKAEEASEEARMSQKSTPNGEPERRDDQPAAALSGSWPLNRFESSRRPRDLRFTIVGVDSGKATARQLSSRGGCQLICNDSTYTRYDGCQIPRRNEARQHQISLSHK